MGAVSRDFGWQQSVSLLAVAAALAGAVYFLNESSVETLLTEDAKRTSQATAHFFEKNIADIERVYAGEKMPAKSVEFILQSLEGTGTDRFKMYDKAGVMVFDSGQVEGVEKGADPLGTHNSAAFAAVKDQKSFVKLEEEVKAEGTELIAESYVPVIRNGVSVGVAEVYVDQTAKAGIFRQSFLWSSGLIALMASVGFAVPMGGFYLRSRQKRLADENVHFLAHHDALTKLPNRNSLIAELMLKLNRCVEDGKSGVLHFIDVDHFKEINDQNGHDFGDQVLCAIAERLRQTLRSNDLVARLGGDEFVVGQFELAGEEQISAATERVVQALKLPLVIDGREHTVTCSIGTAHCPQDGATAETLLSNADTAVYVVKSRGRNGQCNFEPRFDEAKVKRLALEGLIKEATANKRFQLNFQPLIRVGQQELKGFEALLRLRDGDGKPVSPAEFIPVAEDIGLIDEIGSWVLSQACEVAATWPHDLQVSVNLSVAQFKRHSVVDATKDALQKSGLPPDRLLLEITESLLMTDTESVLDQLRQLKQLGVAIVMDDFGTGYSSLGYMLRFPFDRIKIDRSFINEIASGNDSARSIVQTIITLGHTLNMQVTAEGVETKIQADALRTMNCDDAQGYYFGRPMSPEDIPALVLQAFVDGTELLKARSQNLRAAS